jgi:hypothetical protein
MSTHGAFRAADWWSQKHNVGYSLTATRRDLLAEVIDRESGLRALLYAACNLRRWLESHPEAVNDIPDSEYGPFLDAIAYVEGRMMDHAKD